MGKRKRVSLAIKFVIGFAVGALLGFGLCGMNFAGAIAGNARANAMTTLGGIGFVVCFSGLGVSVVVWFADGNKGDD